MTTGTSARGEGPRPASCAPASPDESPVEVDGTTRPTGTAPSLGKLHSGRYRMAELIAEGGMSSVFSAYDTVLERRVAIKVLRADRTTVAGVLAREARVLAAIQHPNVVTVHSLHDEESPFLVMEWIDGDSLDVVLRKRQPTIREALALLRQIADGLDAIHAVGLVHGDIKPANILVGRDGRLRIVDVGLVPRLERMSAGEVLGTPAYMPPERALGAISTPALAPRSDVYSFSVLAFQLLAGRLPFRDEPRGRRVGPTMVAAARRLGDCSELARVFDAPLARGMAEDATRRPASAGALVAALDRASDAVEPGGAILRVLLVDRDAETRARLGHALAGALRGAIIEMVGDGDAALASIRTKLPSVAVIDLSMPGLAGADLLRKVLEPRPLLPVIVCMATGSGTEWSLVRGLGVRQVLLKPVLPEDIVRAIRDAMAGEAQAAT